MDIFLIFFNIKVCCVFSLESPCRGDSNENTQCIIFNINKTCHRDRKARLTEPCPSHKKL